MGKQKYIAAMSAPKVDSNVMQHYNSFVDWMKGKGYSGNPQMNHIDYSTAVFNQYKKEHPETVLTPAHIQPIQEAIHNYRDFLIGKFKSKDPAYIPPDNMKPDYSDFMSFAGTGTGVNNDGIVGQYTSQFKFPSSYLTVIDANNKAAEAKRTGFAASQVMGTNK